MRGEKLKETGAAAGKDDHDRGWVTNRSKGKNKVDIYKSTLQKLLHVLYFHKILESPGAMQLRYRGTVHRQKCILCVTVVLNKG